MSHISEISAAVEPENNRPQERREFLSPDGLWQAVFHDPVWWHMGSEGWHLSVISSDTKLVTTNTDLEALSNGKGLICPLDYMPWSSDSKILSLNSWESGLIFLNPKQNDFSVLHLYPYTVEWSPAAPYLLLFLNDHFAILDEDGNVRTEINWMAADQELPRVGWLASGKVFFVLGRSSKRAKSRITFLAADNGRIIAEESLDPDQLVPYSRDEYASISRAGYSLILDRSSRAVGSLLDRWIDMVYEEGESTIFLSVLRPTSKVYELSGHPACEVEKRWISLKISG